MSAKDALRYLHRQWSADWTFDADESGWTAENQRMGVIMMSDSAQGLRRLMWTLPDTTADLHPDTGDEPAASDRMSI
jgi:hypothetical protein